MFSFIGGIFRKRRFKVVFPIGARLVIVFMLVLFPVLILINVLVSGMASQDLFAAVEEDNFTINSRSAAEAESRLNQVRENVHILLDLVRIVGKDSAVARQTSELFFDRVHYIAAIVVPGYVELVNDQFLEVNGLTIESVSAWVSEQNSPIERARRGDPVIVNPSAEFKIPLTAMFYPWQQNGLEETVIILFSPGEFAEIFGAGRHSSFMTNVEGDVLIHTDFRMLMNNSNLANHPLSAALLETGDRDIRLVYTDEGVKFFGAGKKLSLGNIMFFTSIEYDLPFTRTASAIRRNTYIIISAVFISALLIWLLSKTITNPLKHLAEAMSRVAAGEFDANLEYRIPDEIGVLSENFVKMEKALENRDKFFESQEHSVNYPGTAKKEDSAGSRQNSASRDPGGIPADSSQNRRNKKSRKYPAKKEDSRPGPGGTEFPPPGEARHSVSPKDSETGGPENNGPVR